MEPLPIAEYWSEGALRAALFVLAPNGESFETSLRRVSRAIREDGAFDCLCPGAVYYAYNRHPSLFRTEYENAMLELRRAKSKRKMHLPADPRSRSRRLLQSMRNRRDVLPWIADKVVEADTLRGDF